MLALVPAARLKLLTALVAALVRDASGYAGSLQHVICDVKRSLACKQGCIEQGNYKAIVSGMRNNLGCNGIRVGIDADVLDPKKYSATYRDVVSFARSLNMSIYANPLGVNHFGMTNTETASWIMAYANEWRPNFLGPFNEANFDVDDMLDIIAKVRTGLSYSPVLVGPDMRRLTTSISTLEHHGHMATAVDIFSSHNANNDTLATADNWRRLAELAREGVWASENPRPWDFTWDGKQIGLKAVVDSMTGLVIYLAFPDSVDEAGALTEKGQAIAAGISDEDATILSQTSFSFYTFGFFIFFIAAGLVVSMMFPKVKEKDDGQTPHMLSPLAQNLKMLLRFGKATPCGDD